MKGFVADCRHALRLYARTPASSLIAIFVLAVGMAFVGAFVSLYVDLALERPSGYDDSGRLVTISEVTNTSSYTLRYDLVEQIAAEVTSLEAAVGIHIGSFSFGVDDEIVAVESVTHGFFDDIRPNIALGRGFEAAEHTVDAELIAVISDRFWQRAFGSRPDVLGETFELAGVPSNGGQGAEPISFRIVGVMASGMRGVSGDEIDLWAPYERMIPVLLGEDANIEQARAEAYLRTTIGRLRPGVSVEAAVSEIQARLPEATTQGPEAEISAVRGIVPNIRIYRETRQQLELFLAGSVLLALVAAANVSLFLLARAPGRRREIAIRLSVGAPFRRLARQLMIEASFLVVVSAGLGLVFSAWLAELLRGMAFLRNADWGDIALLDWRVLILLTGLLLVLCLLIALAPVLGIRHLGLASSGRATGARATLAQRVAGNIQIAIAGALGGVAVAFSWFLGPALFGDPGFEIDDRHYVMFVHRSMFSATGGETSRAVDSARHREFIESLPGVERVSLSFIVPANALIDEREARDPADASRSVTIGFGRIDERFADVLGLRFLHGRNPGPGEIGVSLVNQALARRLFGRENVVGEFLDVSAVMRRGPNFDPERRSEIVGVVEDMSFSHPAAVVEPLMLTSLPIAPLNFHGSIIESSLTPAALHEQLQSLYDSGSIDLEPNVARSLRDQRAAMLAPDKARGLLTIITATLVVFLAAFGFYGTQRYLVGAGRREYAIRASLGAGPRALGRLVFVRGFAMTPIGLGLGTVLAFLCVAWLRDEYLSQEIAPGVVACAVAIGLSMLMIGASVGPAREARRTQPAELLRED